MFLWPDFWMPIVESPDDTDGANFLSNRGMHNIWVLGKLKPGITPAQATDNLNSIARDLAREYPADDGLGARLVKPGLMGDMFGDPARSFMAGIMLLAFLVLLAACANLASLFAARTADRSREWPSVWPSGRAGGCLAAVAAEAVLISLLGVRWEPSFQKHFWRL